MLISSRLHLKPWTPEQADAFFELSHDAGFTLFPIKVYRQDSVASALQWILDHQEGKWGVWEISTGQLIGMGGLTPWKLKDESLIDITYRLRESAWGRGLGLELARTLVEQGKSSPHQITATIRPDNLPSKVIAGKLGMVFDQQILLLGHKTDLFRLPVSNFTKQT